MKQPELGKKIAELRKAKGLTQDELVEKCNLNVRTLQRIESGEVTPRSYTVRIIFAALDYTVDDSSKSLPHKFVSTGLMVNRWLGQLYTYIIDLFNLKTNTMKKLMILSIPFFTICLVLIFSFNANVKAQAKMAVREKFEKTSSNARFVEKFNTGQIDSLSMLYHDHACMMPDMYPTITDRNGIRDYYRQLYAQGLRFSQVKTISKVISDSFAIERGIWEISINSVPVANGTYLTQWHYIDGQWWIENEMSKSDKPDIPQ